MTRVLAKPVRAEGATIAILTTAFTARGYVIPTTLGIGTIIPTAPWTSTTVPFLQVATDGTPIIDPPVLWRASVRITAWAFTTTAAQDLAQLAESLLYTYGGSATVASFEPLTGVLPTKDAATGAQLAMVALRANLRGITFN